MMGSWGGLNPDFADMLHALVESNVEFVVVGAHAMAMHGMPRATGDLDIFVRPSPENAARVLDALRAFGAPLDAHGVTLHDLTTPGTVYQLGLPPRRIDLLTEISGLSFREAWASRVVVDLDSLRIGFLGRDALIRNKRATGRDKDLVDLRILEHRSDDC